MFYTERERREFISYRTFRRWCGAVANCCKLLYILWQAGPIVGLAQSQPPPSAERFLIIIFCTIFYKAPKRGRARSKKKARKEKKERYSECICARFLTSDLNAIHSGSAFATTTEQRAFRFTLGFCRFILFPSSRIFCLIIKSRERSVNHSHRCVICFYITRLPISTREKLV